MDICADILNIARGGAKKTHLVYKANLNFNIVKKYLRKLTNQSLILSENGHYITTEEEDETYNADTTEYTLLVQPGSDIALIQLEVFPSLSTCRVDNCPPP